MARESFSSIGNFFRRGAAYAHKYYLRRLMPKVGPVLHAQHASILDWRLFDRILPADFRPPEIYDIPGYEEKLVTALNRAVKPGDRVLVIGGGAGTTAVVAAKLAGAGGSTICYEASAEQLPIIQETFRRNSVDVDLRFAAVGAAIGVYGDQSNNMQIVSPKDLPVCDVLEMDCEGAERIILDQMQIRPRYIAVETHGIYDSPTEAVARQLKAIGYDVENLGIAEPRLASTCEDNDVRVLFGIRRDH